MHRTQRGLCIGLRGIACPPRDASGASDGQQSWERGSSVAKVGAVAPRAAARAAWPGRTPGPTASPLPPKPQPTYTPPATTKFSRLGCFTTASSGAEPYSCARYGRAPDQGGPDVV